MIRKTTYANDRVRGSGSDVPMGGLVMWRCACDDCDGNGDSGNIDVDLSIAIAYSRAVFGQDSM